MDNSTLPSFAYNFLNNLKLKNKSLVTIEGYKFDLIHFFNFLCEHRENPEIFTELMNKSIPFSPLPSSPQEITLVEFKKITHWHIESYLAYVEDERSLAPRSVARKQAAIKSLYNYLFRKDLIQSDVSKKLDPISLPDEDVIAMEPEEVATLVELIELGKGQTAHQRRFSQYTTKRDLAIILSFLGSGLRLMELQRLDLDDVNFNKNQFHIKRKRNKIRNQPFNEDIAIALQAYLDVERPRMANKNEETQAFFLSLQGNRISRRAIQDMVNKFMVILSGDGFKTDKYTVHKLRSTCATLLLRETGNLPLVQDYLDHKDPKTTRKYAKIVDEELQRASSLIKFK